MTNKKKHQELSLEELENIIGGGFVNPRHSGFSRGLHNNGAIMKPGLELENYSRVFEFESQVYWVVTD